MDLYIIGIYSCKLTPIEFWEMTPIKFWEMLQCSRLVLMNVSVFRTLLRKHTYVRCKKQVEIHRLSVNYEIFFQSHDNSFTTWWSISFSFIFKIHLYIYISPPVNQIQILDQIQFGILCIRGNWNRFENENPKQNKFDDSRRRIFF